MCLFSWIGADNRIKEHLLSLYVLYVQPFSSQEVTTTNLYDFDLPSGLSCIGTALCIMDLYKRLIYNEGGLS